MKAKWFGVSYGPLLFVSLLLVSLLTSVLSPLIARADDYGFTFTDEVHVGGPPDACAVQDLTTNWAEIMDTDSGNPLSYKNSVSYTANAANMDAFAAQFATNVGAGSGWGVAQFTSAYSPGHPGVKIFLFDPTADINIPYDQTITTSTGHFWEADFFTQDFWGCAFQNYRVNDTSNTYLSLYDHEILFIASDNIIYPGDYTGADIPTSVVTNPDLYPPFVANVSGQDIEFVPKHVDTGVLCYKNFISLYNSDTELVDGGVDFTARDEPVTLHAPTSDDGYYITFGNVDCGTPFLNISSEYDLHVQTIPLTIDGSTYTLNSDTLDCALGDGICTVPSQYEDCSTYGVDIVGGIGCVIGNFGVFLKGILIALFVPPNTFLKGYFASAQEFFTSKFGFLATSITIVFNVLGELVTSAATPSCTLNPGGTFFGATVSFNACELEDINPGIFDAIVLVVRSMTFLAVIFALWRTYMHFIRGDGA